MKKTLSKRLISILLLVCATTANATFIGDEITVRYDEVFVTSLINDSAVVGDGVEFAEQNLFKMLFELDFTANSFTLTLTKPQTAGNFTGIFKRLSITNIDAEVSNVWFDDAVSSAFNDNRQPDIDWSNAGQIDLSADFFLSANTPASALTHSFTWNVDFVQQSVSSPSTLAIMLMGLIIVMRRRLQKTRTI